MIDVSDIDQLKKELIPALADEVEQRIDKKLNKKLIPISKKLDLIVRYFDSVTTNHRTRIKRIETHLQLPSVSD